MPYVPSIPYTYIYIYILVLTCRLKSTGLRLQVVVTFVLQLIRLGHFSKVLCLCVVLSWLGATKARRPRAAKAGKGHVSRYSMQARKARAAKVMLSRNAVLEPDARQARRTGKLGSTLQHNPALISFFSRENREKRTNKKKRTKGKLRKREKSKKKEGTERRGRGARRETLIPNYVPEN